MTSTFFTSCNALRLKGADLPAARQSRFCVSDWVGNAFVRGVPT